jgi:hypothetical protein
MKKNLALWLIASSSLAAFSAAGDVPATDSPLDLTTALRATSPHPTLGDQGQVPGRLVGTWDVEYTTFAKDGTASQRTGEFIVEWVMDGRAIQDLWIVHPSGTRKEREVYTDLHWFDARSRTWRSAFVDPEHGSVAKFTGGPVGDDRYVLETPDLGSKQTRWSFYDIRRDSFAVRGEASNDDGKTWKLESEYKMKRQRAN